MNTDPALTAVSGCISPYLLKNCPFLLIFFSYLSNGSSSHIYKFVQPFFFFFHFLTTKMKAPGTSLAVWWLRLHASTAGDEGSVPGWGTKILHAMRCGPQN